MSELKGKLPPQAVEIEEAILSAMMIDKKAVDVVLDIFSGSEFYLEKHSKIFAAISQLQKKSDPIDLLTVVQQLKLNGDLESVGGQMYIIELSQKIASAAHIEKHARIVQQQFIKREFISMATNVIDMCFDETKDVFNVIEGAGTYFDGINNILDKSYQSETWENAVMAIPKRVERLTNNQGKITGLPTGLDATDRHFSGWQPTDFIVIGADSGMGKTAFVMCSMLAAARDGNAVGMFSMEMSVAQLAIRAMAVESNFHMNQLARVGFANDAENHHAEYFNNLWQQVERLKDYPIHIDDKPALTVPEMKRKARAMKRKHDIKLLVIDFIQMFSGDRDIRINVGDAARECKNLAKELNIPVIALSQISREVKKSPFHLPRKYHLKEASAIEEAADVICMLYRPGYYGYEAATHSELWDQLGLPYDCNASLMVVKNRNGALANVPLNFLEDKTKYINKAEVETQHFM